MSKIERIPSTCQGCLTNCSVLVEVQDGRVVDVAGNPASAATNGAICNNVKIAMQQAIDPDRLLYPMKRTNPAKGRSEDPKFTRITWDEALDEIADRLISLRQRGESHKVAIAKGRSTGIGGLFSDAFPKIYGTPNSINHDSICDQGETVALGCLDGMWDYRDVDYSTCEYIIFWGMDPLASNRWKSRFRHEIRALRKHAHLVVIDPRESLTARVADEWHPIMPGTDGALACAIAHVIVSEGLCDCELLSRDTLGFDSWWDEVLQHTTPEWAEGECGIPAEDIRRIARGFAAAGPHAVSWTSPGLAMAKRGFYNCMAAHALNGLVGSVQAQGGLVAYSKVPRGKLPNPMPFQDVVAQAACMQEPVDQRNRLGFLSAKDGKAGAGQNMNFIPDALAASDPYEIDTLISYWCNFAYSAPGCRRWWDALANIPFFVDVTTHISESSRFADIVLPARHHLFETWGVCNSRQGGRSCVSLEQPCIPAPGETRGDESDVPFDLAIRLSKRGFPNLLDYYRTIVDPQTGAIPGSGEELAEYATKRVFFGGIDKSRWNEVLQQGVVNGPSIDFVAEGGPLPTPSGKFEFASSVLRTIIDDYACHHGLSPDEALASLEYVARGDVAFLPHYEPPVRRGDKNEHPFVFTQHRSHASLEGRAANTPLFQELKGTDPGDEAWDDVVKLHPDDMVELGLSDGDDVRVVSPYGSICVHAKAWDGVRQGVVAKCYGQGHWAYGSIAAGRGGNNNEIMPAEWDRITSSAVRHGGIVRVRIERIG